MFKDEKFFDLQRFATRNTKSNTLVSGTSGDDTISSYPALYSSVSDADKISYVTINGGAGNDSIWNIGYNTSINAGSGNDTIWQDAGDYVVIDGGDGNDSIRIGGDGKCHYASINGGAGNDFILNNNSADNVTIAGGAGDDKISLRYYGSTPDNNVFLYNDGDGNDVIYGFNETSTLEIANSSYSTKTSGSDIVVTVGDGSITLQGAATLSTVNIVSTIILTLGGGPISLTSGADNYYNTVDGATILDLGGNDDISNSGNNVSILGGDGNDTITNYGVAPTVTSFSAGKNVRILAGSGNDFVDNSGANAYIELGAGNDTLVNTSYGLNSTILGGDGTDSIINSANAKIDGGAGNDTITNTNLGGNSTLLGGAGNDYITTYNADNVSIDGGAGNDMIELRGSGKNITVTGGAGKDTISIADGDALVKYVSGNDIIYGFNETSTLSIASGSYSTAKSGDDIIVTVGDGKISLIGAASLSAVNIDGQEENLLNIVGTSDSDYLYNSLSGATINALGGNDSIYNYYDASVSINGGAGNDYISNDGDKVTISGGAGNDSIINSGDNVTIDGGAGNDYISNDGDKVTISGGGGNDSIDNYGSEVTISGGAGNDSIDNYYGDSVKIDAGAGNDSIYNNCYRQSDGSIYYYTDNYGANVLFKYSSGDGNDFIGGFNANSTLQIGDGTGTYSTVANGGNVIVTVGTGKISLMGAASLSAVNIDGEEIPIETNSWKLSGTTATYGTTSSTLATVKGVKSLDGLSVSSKTVTVSKAALGTSNVSITGTGYKLALGDDVTKSATTKKSWSMKDSSTATYKQTKSAYYALASNSKSITYTKSTSSTLATVKGVKSTSGLSISGKTVTVSKAALGTSNVSITGTGYKLALGSDVTKSATTKKSWSLSGSTATYKQTKSAYYTIASNKITYHKSTNSNTLATVKGVKSLDGLSVDGKTVTVSNASLNKKAVTISSGYTLKLGSDVTKSTSTAAKWSLSGTTATYKSAKKTTGYKLASNKISYVTASGGSTLATVKGVKSKPTLSGNVITLKTSNIGASKKVSVSGNYEFDFAAGDYKKTSITGTANADTIKVLGTNAIVTGGKGNDSLVSNSSGGNVFVYSSGDGNDVITNFAASDKLSIKSATTYSVSGNDVIFTIGTGSITVKDAKDKTFTYYDSGGEKTYKLVDNSNDKGITLPSDYADTDFDVTTVTGGSKIVTIDASAVKHGLNITGNALANSIVGGKGNDTLDGGSDKKNDTLRGGAGADVFYYVKNNGNDVIADYKEEDKIYIRGTLDGTPTGDGRDMLLKISGGGKITVKDADKNGYGITYVENGVEHDWKNGKQTVTFNGNDTVIISENYWKESFDLSNFGNRKLIDATKFSKGLYITGNGYVNEIRCGTGNDTLEGGRGDDTCYGGEGKDVFVYSSSDGNDVIVDYTPKDDKIKIKGTINYDDYYTKDDDVVLKVGSGRITVQNAVNKYITIEDDTGTETKTYSGKPLNSADADDEMFFYEDDAEFISADNQLSSLVRDGAINYSVLQTDNSLSLTAKNDSLPALTYSAKNN